MGWNPFEDDDSGTPWETGMFQCLNPNAQNVFDFDHLCTSCACPCAQFYFNWLKILEGAPVAFRVLFLILSSVFDFFRTFERFISVFFVYQEYRFYCMNGACVKCVDPVHAAAETLCCIFLFPWIACKVRGVRMHAHTSPLLPFMLLAYLSSGTRIHSFALFVRFSFSFAVCLIGCLENLLYFFLQMIRKQSEIDGSVWMDCGHSFFCLPFALAQEARQLEKKPFKGGSIVPLPLWRRLIKPCFPERVMDKALLEAARKVTSYFLNELFSHTF